MNELLGILEYRQALHDLGFSFQRYISDGLKVAEDKPRPVLLHFDNADFLEELFIKVHTQLFLEHNEHKVLQASLIASDKLLTSNFQRFGVIENPLYESIPIYPNDIGTYFKKYLLKSPKAVGILPWLYKEEEEWYNGYYMPTYYYEVSDTELSGLTALLVITVEDEDYKENGVDYFYKVKLSSASDAIKDAEIDINEFMPKVTAPLGLGEKPTLECPQAPIIPISPVVLALLDDEGLVPRSENIFIGARDCWNC